MSNSNNETPVDKFDFDAVDVQPRSEPVTYKGKKYTLTEASGDAAVRYQNKMSSAAKLSQDGKLAELKDLADSEPFLVSLCLTDDETKKNVSINFVRSLPNRMMQRLYDWIKENSDLKEQETKASLLKKKEALEKKIKEKEEEEELSKNSSSDTVDG